MNKPWLLLLEYAAAIVPGPGIAPLKLPVYLFFSSNLPNGLQKNS